MTQNLAYTALELSSMGLKKLLYLGTKEAAYIQEGKKKRPGHKNLEYL